MKRHQWLGKTLLLVDDNRILRDSYRELLEEQGYRVMTAGSGETALALLKEKAPVDLVLTDYKMPGMDGQAVIAAVKRLAPSVPVIMLSASVDAETRVRALECGAAACIEKKGCTKELLYAIAAAFHDK